MKNKEELSKYAPYSTTKPIPACLRNHLGMLDLFGGKGPIYMQTADAIKRIAESEPDEKKKKKKLKELDNEAWEDFLDMTISQAILWAATNVEPDKMPSEIAPCEPYFIGSHSGASGAWVSGPEDLAPPEYFWGYANMTTVKGLFAAGDASGASSHKFSSGSHAEGRIAAKSAIKFIVENKDAPEVDMGAVAKMKETVFKPMATYEEHSKYTEDPNVNPNYIKPRDFMFRLQKIMDEYAGGVTMHFTTNEKLLEKGMELLTFLKEDSEKLAAEDDHELMRCWENIQRMWQAEAHVRALMFREETRWPGYYYRADKPELDDKDWKVFVNLTYNPDTGEWKAEKKPVIPMNLD